MSSRSHVIYLDSIRGLAALTVINDHFVIAYGLPCENQICQKILDYLPLNFWWDGGAAVSMFFVLSGLVLSLKYFRLGHKPDLNHFNLIGYTVGRLFRIWLPYSVILFISAILYFKVTENPILTTLLPPSGWLTEMWHTHHLTTVDMLREGFLLKLPPLIVLVPQAWTLTIELVLSLLLPVGLLLAERGTVWIVFFTLFAVALLGVSIFLLHFLLGLIIARYYSIAARYLTDNYWQRWLILLIGIFFYTSGSLFESSKVSETVVWLSSGLGAGLILLFVIGSVRTQTVLSHPVLRQIGKISYSAYLTHMLILLCLTPHFLAWLESFTINRFALWLGGYLLTVMVVQLLSLFFYYSLEIPSITLGRSVTHILRAFVDRSQ